VCAAWELIEAFGQIKPTKKPLTIAILDGGFWLNGRTPGAMAPDTGSDFGISVYQLNLLDEDVGAGGASPNKCGDAYTCAWHGNGTASIATAIGEQRTWGRRRRRHRGIARAAQDRSLDIPNTARRADLSWTGDWMSST
jgi:hypothetical protein